MKYIRNINALLNIAIKLLGGAWLVMHTFFHQLEPAFLTAMLQHGGN